MKKIISGITAMLMTGFMAVPSNLISADAALDLPDNYKSALSFYENNGETVVTADGKEAIIVIPCINSEQYAYVMEHSDGCTVNLAGTYYQGDKGFEVYKADLDGVSDIEIMYEFYDLEKNEKAFAGEDIELNYNCKNGKFEADAVPKTAMQAEILMKNGGIKSEGKKVIIALSQAQSAGFKLEQLNNDSTSSEPSGLTAPVLKYSDSETLCDSVAHMNLYNGRLERPAAGSSTVVYEYEFGQQQGSCVLTFAEKRGNFASEIHRISLFGNDESVEIKSHETFLNGDATMDGKINVFDAVKIAKSTINSSELNSEQKMLSDVDYNGTVNIFDAVTVAKKTV